MSLLRQLTQYRPGRIARNSVASTAVLGAKLLFQLPLVFLLARYLGPEEYGEFAGLVALATGIGTLASFGTGFLVLGDSARNLTEGERTLSMALPLTLVTACALLPLYLGSCWYLLNSSAKWPLLMLIAATELLAVPLIQILAQRIRGAGNVVLAQGYMLIPIFMRLLGLIACILLAPEASLTAYTVAYFTTTALSVLAIILITSYKTGWPEAFHWPDLEIVKRGVKFAIMMFTNRNPTELDKSLALRFLSSSEAGVYSIAARGTMIAVLPALAILQATQPRLFQIHQDQPLASRRLVAAALGAALGVGIISGLSLAIAGPPLLAYALGPEFRDLEKVLFWFGFIAPVMALRIGTGEVFIVLERPLVRTAIEATALILLVAMAIGLTPRWGLLGILAAVASAETFMALALGATLWIMLRNETADNRRQRGRSQRTSSSRP